MAEGTSHFITRAKSERLLTFTSGGWILLLALILSLVPVFWVLNNRRPVSGDGRHLDSYGFNLATTLIPKEKIIPAGFAKNALRALVNPDAELIPDFQARDEKARRRLMVSDDRIIAVTIGGQSRAYPIHVVAMHEVINDTLGDQSIAITYSPLCDSVVVFDRNMNGRILEFGVAGVLVNSNLVMFDRQPNPQDESLWSQLQFRAIAGHAAGKKLELTRIPAVITRWAEWIKSHPDGTIVTGLREWHNEYLRKRYATYFISNELKFPVDPQWQPKDGFNLKTPIVAVPNGNQWIVHKADTFDTFPENGIASFMFAWYAMWPGSQIESSHKIDQIK